MANFTLPPTRHPALKWPSKFVLQKPFYRSFRTWLQNIYKSIYNLPRNDWSFHLTAVDLEFSASFRKPVPATFNAFSGYWWVSVASSKRELADTVCYALFNSSANNADYLVSSQRPGMNYFSPYFSQSVADCTVKCNLQCLGMQLTVNCKNRNVPQ